MTSAPSSIELRVGESEALDITPFVDRFVWSESMLAGGFSWDIKFKTEKWAEWDRLMLGRDEPRHQFRLRVQGASGADTTEWRTAITDKSRAAFAANTGMVGQISGADTRLKMAQQSRTRVWKELRASEVLTRIAADYGLEVAIDNSASTRTHEQLRMNDWAFARRVARYATTESGRCDTYLWLDENTLRFSAPQLTEASVRRYDMSVMEDRVNDYAGAYFGRGADRQGAARLRGVGFDWKTKTGSVFTMDAARAQSQPSLASRVPRRMEDGLRVYPVFDEARGVVEERVRARWGRVAPRYFSMRVNTRPDLTVRPNTVIAVESNLDIRRETPFTGRYVVLEVLHTLENSSIVTSLICYRREAHEGEAQPTGANADNASTSDSFESVGTQARSTIKTAVVLP